MTLFFTTFLPLPVPDFLVLGESLSCDDQNPFASKRKEKHKNNTPWQTSTANELIFSDASYQENFFWEKNQVPRLPSSGMVREEWL